MVTPDRAFAGSFTFGEFVLGILADILTLALLLMAAFTEMGVSPAEPLSYAAAELTLELYVFLAVFWTVLHRDFTTIRADQLFRLKISASLVHGILARLSPSEVRVLALETLIV